MKKEQSTTYVAKPQVHNQVPQSQPSQNPYFRPAHYTQYKVDYYTVNLINQLPFGEGEVVKYITRWQMKNGIEDLQKAKRVIEMMIELEMNKSDYVAEKTSL